MEALKLPDIQVDEKEVAILEQQAAGVIAQAQEVARGIHDPNTCAIAVAWVRDQQTFIKNIEGGFLGEMRDSLHNLHKRFCSKISDIVGPSKSGILIVNNRINEWRQVEERKRQEEQRRLFEEARKKDEEERLRKAEELEKKGNKTLAEAELSGVGNFVAPVIAPQEKVKGVVVRRAWKVDVFDKHQFVKFIAERPTMIALLEINVGKIEEQAKSLDGNITYPGIRVFEKETSHVRS